MNRDRRAFLLGSVGAATGSLFAYLGARLAPGPALALSKPPPGRRPPGPARACVVLWLNGGPSHIDTFDPKPGTATGGPFGDIPTRVAGLRLSQHLPQLAEQAHHLAVLRGMTSKEGNHQRAQYLLHTGYPPNPTVAYPALGSWVSEELADPRFDLPSFVSVRGPSAGAGFLGVQHGPFIVDKPGAPPDNTDYARQVDFVRFLRRQSALSYLDDRFQQQAADPKLRGRDAVREKATRMMYAPKLRAFDLSDEPEAVQAAYGDHDFGRGCLLARRLVENGVHFVEVVLDGWDTHQDNFNRVQKLSGTLDGSMAALIRDLEARQMLGRTLIVCMGDFGRTPQINPKEGRDHYPQAFSAVLCGGGVRGGVVHGATDAEGRKVVDRPVSVPDLFATLATLLGMDPDKEVRTPLGRPVTLTQNGQPIRDLMA